jgi:signal transduction histidine kinase
VRARLLILLGLGCLLSVLRGQGDLLTPAERNWVSSHPRIRVGYDPDWPPFSFRAPDGHLVGIDADLLEVLSQRLGLTFDIIPSSDWTMALQDATEHKIDLLLSTVSTPDRAGKFEFSRPYLSFPMAVVTLDTAAANATFSELNGKRIAAVLNYAVSSELKAHAPRAIVIPCTSISAALEAVANGTADAAMTNLANATFLIQTRGLTNLRVVGLPETQADARYAVRADWPELVDILNRGIATLTRDEIRAIDDRWIQVNYGPPGRRDLVWKIGIPVLLVLIVVMAAISYHSRQLARELAARIQLQTEIEATRDELKRLNDDKVWLMEMAAHDLRSPLTAMQLLADLSLKQRLIAPEEALTKLEPHIARMLALLNRLFAVDAIERGRRPLEIRPLDLGELAQGVVRAAHNTCAAKNIQIEAHGAESRLQCLGDEVAVRQVIENLVSNAIKFSPPGSIITVSLRPADATVRLEVRDHGPGVPDSERKRIFLKYARGSAQPTAGEPSTGLGLAIARTLLETMHGRIWCEAAQPGARFVVVLPAAIRQS